MKKILITLMLSLLLAGCGSSEPPLRVGSKNFGENRILANMLAELARENGIPVTSITEYPTTQAIQEALKRDQIDIYPEYNGTGLVMLGQNPLSDGDASMARVRELYEPLSMTWLSRLGFANNYGLAISAQRAEELGVTSISDLVKLTGELTLGIEDDFIKRPLDGIQPMSERYGLEFSNIVQVPLEERLQLYDQLLDGSVDLIEVYTTDGQLADYGLVVLEDDLEFFPVYEASALMRTDALTRHGSLRATLEQLSGRLDDNAMRELNGRVDIEGRTPLSVARDALAQMQLIDSGAASDDDPLYLAAAPSLLSGTAATTALRAVRQAFRGRSIEWLATDQPLSELDGGQARMALVSASDLFDMNAAAPLVNLRFEAVAPISQSKLHIVVSSDNGPASLADIQTLLTGPEGSTSANVAHALKTGLALSATLEPSEVNEVETLTSAVRNGDADAALIMLVEGASSMSQALEDGSLKLLPINDWNEGANLIRYPFLRQSRLAADTYPSQNAPVETLSTQLVLAGPAARPDEVVGDQGPSSISSGQMPISPKSVLALNAALPDSTLIDPTLNLSKALLPELPEPPAPLNPATDISVLTFLVFVLFIWLIWLYARPDYR